MDAFAHDATTSQGELDSPFTAPTGVSGEDVSGSRVQLFASRPFPTFGSGEQSLGHSFDGSCEVPQERAHSSDSLLFASSPEDFKESVMEVPAVVTDAAISTPPSMTAGKPPPSSSWSEQKSLWQQEEEFHRKQRASRRRYQLELEDMEHRLSEMATAARTELDQLGKVVENHQRSALSLEEVLKKTMSGVAQLSTMLTQKEQQTAELGDLVADVSQTLSHLVVKVDTEMQRIHDLENKVEALHGSTSQLLEAEGSLAKKSSDGKSVQHALRKLENLVMRESEYRAAGIREVLEQSRSEHAKRASEIEGRCKAEQEILERRLEERLSQFEALSAEHRHHHHHDTLSSSAEHRHHHHHDTLSNSAEHRHHHHHHHQQQHHHHHRPPSSQPRHGGDVSGKRNADSPGSHLSVDTVFECPAVSQAGLQEHGATRDVVEAIPVSLPKPTVSASESKLEALEARFDCHSSVGNTPLLDTTELVRQVASPITHKEDTPDPQRGRGSSAIEKLRDQLAGLRMELATGLEGPRIDAKTADLGVVRSRDQSLLSDAGQTQASSPLAPSEAIAVGPLVSLPVPSATAMARTPSAPSCHSLLSQVPAKVQPAEKATQPVNAFGSLHMNGVAQVNNKCSSGGSGNLCRAFSEASLNPAQHGSSTPPSRVRSVELVQAAPTMESVPTFSMGAPPRVGPGSVPAPTWPTAAAQGQLPGSKSGTSAQALTRSSMGSHQLC
mmetsp:Transcript_49119/g.116965  ORF Transcript_49119/g.116965 Transcript_49119/m.116965 type:complete len:725 (+) Transcript_49119:63-2237(+)